jgi:hypothetical protein
VKKLAIALCLATAGCLTPSQPWQDRTLEVETSGVPSGTTDLLSIDPASIGAGGPASLEKHAAELERRYVERVEVEGVVWQPQRSSASLAEPDQFGAGGDSLVFTGVALAGWTWKHAVTGDSDRVVEAVRGLWILTHVAGRGVLCRAAFPSRRAVEFGWPGAWSGRDPRFVGETPAGAVPDPIRGGHLPALRWYTRATRDQLTGLVFGLSSAWRLATDPTTDPALAALVRPVVAQIVRDVFEHLRTHDWRIRDALGQNDTSADDVDGLLRVAVLGLARAVGVPNADRDYRREFRRAVEHADLSASFDRFNNVSAYYAHGLRAMRCYSIWLLDEDPERRAQTVDYSRTHWRRWTDRHGNAWLAWLWFAMAGTAPDEGLRALYELRWKPIRLWPSPLAGRWNPPSFNAATADTTHAWVLPVYLRKPTSYFIWQKAPWDAGDERGDTRGLGDSTGVDFLAAYWLGRAHGFIGPLS